MMDEIWYEEELEPSDETVDETAKSLITRSGDVDKGKVKEDVKKVARGVVRVHTPRWQKLDPAVHQLLSSGGRSHFYIVRLGFEFDLVKESKARDAQFVYGRCSAYLWPGSGGQPQPVVYEVIPRDLYEGEQRKVVVKLAPQIELADAAEVSLGEASTDLFVGTVEPAVVGFLGEEERAPYWELRPKSKSLIGTRQLWMVVEVPDGCEKTRLAVMVEGDVQANFGPIPLGPMVREWGKRPSIIIG